MIDAVHAALSKVIDPEIRRPITELGMVREVVVNDDGIVRVTVDLTVPGCPLKSKIEADVRTAVGTVPGVSDVVVELGVMNDEQRAGLRAKLQGTAPTCSAAGGSGGAQEAEPIAFARPDSRTKVFAVASGKGGVGKSTVTANLAAALATRGLRVGLVDADVYGFSIPRMLGALQPPTKTDGLLVPPVAHGVKVVSIGQFVPSGQAVAWRGPMLHRALEQFLVDVHWGDLDVLLLDLPPGTGDIAISVAHLLPNAQIVVVTTPQAAASEVAARAGAIAAKTHQSVVGVIENMAWLEQPDGSRLEIFGSGGGHRVAESLAATLATPVPLLGQIPLDPAIRAASDAGTPVVLADPQSSGAQAMANIATQLATL